ncbi:MAG: PIN domain-containing protein [Microbacterium sp.]
MIVVDANVIISLWGRPDAHTSQAVDVVDTEEELMIHPVTLAEYLVGPARLGAVVEALEDCTRLGVERYVPPVDEPVRVVELRATTGLKLPDAYVLATAVELGATLATFDRRLADAARERGVAVVGA